MQFILKTKPIKKQSENESRSVLPESLRPHGLQPARLSVHGILQARRLEWVAMPSSRGSSPPRDRTHVSHRPGGFFTI